MDGSYRRPRKTPSSDRILALFSNPAANDATALASSAADGELDEGEVFWTGTEFDSSAQDNSTAPPSSAASPPRSPSPSSSPVPTRGFQSPSFSSAGSFRRASFGILAALPEDSNDAARPQITPRAVTRSPSFLSQRLPAVTTTTAVVGGGGRGGDSISSSPSTASASPSSATSATAAARAIPAIPRPRLHDYSSFSMPVRQQSAPVNVPLPQGRHKVRRAFGEEEPAAAAAKGTNGAAAANGGEDEDEEEMMPPHEIVARASAKDSPMTTFSVLEGAGRTLKGRDLRRVRNAVWRQTGFLD